MSKINEIVKNSLSTYNKASTKQKAEMLDFLKSQVKNFERYGVGKETEMITAAKQFITKL